MSLIVGPYYRGDPKAKPLPWGTISDRIFAVRRYFEDVLSVTPPGLYYPMWERAGEELYNYGTFQYQYNNWVNSPTWAHDYLAFDTNDYCEFVQGSSLFVGLSKLTVMAEVMVDSDGVDHWIVTRGTVADSPDGIILLWADDVGADSKTDTFAFSVGAIGTAGNRATGTTGLRTVGEWHNVCGVMSGSARRLYHNGDLNATNSGGDSTIGGFDLQRFRIASWEQNDGDLDGRLKFFLVAPDVYFQTTISTLYDNPFGPIQPYAAPIYFDLAAGGGTTIPVFMRTYRNMRNC